MHPPPPHFLASPRDPSRPAVAATVDLDRDIVDLTVTGPWSVPLSSEAAGAIDKCLAQQPLALVVDLRFLEDPGTDSAPVWTAAADRAAGLHPRVPVAICLPRPASLADRLSRLGAGRSLPIFPSPAHARTTIPAPSPPADRIRVPLPCHVDTPALARTLVAAAAEQWGLAWLVSPACKIVSELVVNALETGTDAQLIVVRRPDGVHVAVHDREPQLPTLPQPWGLPAGQPVTGRPSGLRRVHATATDWGATPTIDGKVVWACLRGPTSGHRNGETAPPHRV